MTVVLFKAFSLGFRGNVRTLWIQIFPQLFSETHHSGRLSAGDVLSWLEMRVTDAVAVLIMQKIRLWESLFLKKKNGENSR